MGGRRRRPRRSVRGFQHVTEAVARRRHWQRLRSGSAGAGELEKIRTEVTRGTSALFLVTEHGNLDRLGERFHGRNSTLIATNLTEAEKDVLYETFGGR